MNSTHAFIPVVDPIIPMMEDIECFSFKDGLREFNKREREREIEEGEREKERGEKLETGKKIGLDEERRGLDEPSAPITFFR